MRKYLLIDSHQKRVMQFVKHLFALFVLLWNFLIIGQGKEIVNT